MVGALQGRPEGHLARVTVGVADVLPKLVAYELIEPALKLERYVSGHLSRGDEQRVIAGFSGS